MLFYNQIKNNLTPKPTNKMSSSIALSATHMVEAIRFVSLPRELQTPNDVASFAALVLDLDSSSVKIVSMKTESGVSYRSAFVDINASKASPEMLQRISDEGIVIQDRAIPGGIHFDNGKSMSHIKVIAAKKQAPSTNPLTLDKSDWSSIYIPVIPSDLGMDNGDIRYTNEDELAELFEDQLKIGRVSRVDFVNKAAPGADYQIKSAYVHFDCWYDNQTTTIIRKTISDKGEFWCNGFYDGFEFCRFERGRFITFKINHKPIPVASADMNVHQLAAAKEFLDKKVSDLEAQNEALQLNVEALNEEIKQQSTVQRAFEQVRLVMDAIKLEAESPDFEGVDFDYVEALKELYEEYVPIIWR
jgi:hypothetical protein